MRNLPTFHTVNLRDAVWVKYRGAWRAGIIAAYTRVNLRVSVEAGRGSRMIKVRWNAVAWRRTELRGSEMERELDEIDEYFREQDSHLVAD